MRMARAFCLRPLLRSAGPRRAGHLSLAGAPERSTGVDLLADFGSEGTMDESIPVCRTSDRLWDKPQDHFPLAPYPATRPWP